MNVDRLVLTWEELSVKSDLEPQGRREYKERFKGWQDFIQPSKCNDERIAVDNKKGCSQ